ncbi:hypothetical protein [Vallicoccus soli]|uniref:hypothetical protein n=1 Tax=Vallicoccus soli TaxID=2339232 RepID=UPI0014021ABC|nr:hypothetical protein [Vallicoccus soli]
MSAHDPVACSRCGASADAPPVTWSAEQGPRGRRWVCASCVREHVRSIEGRLDEAWW